MVDFFFGAYSQTSTLNIFLEINVFVFGILSVWYAGKENILVFPTGIIATVITVYLLYLAGYLGDMILNGYFSLMSIYGWLNWSRKSNSTESLKITRTSLFDKFKGLGVFLFTLLVVYLVYTLVGNPIAPEQYIDIVTSGIFFTAMYYMALKKIENWTLWILGNLISIPLYAYRGLGILSLQFIIFTAISVMAYLSWYKTIKSKENE